MTNIIKPVSYSQTWTFFEGKWHEGNAPIMGPRTHAAWLGSTVFDGARAFEGVAPDLDRHCARVNWSATNFRLKPVVDTETWIGLAREGIARFGANAELYIRPMYCAQHGSGGGHPDHAVTVPPSDHGDRTRRRQAGMPLSQQFTRADRSGRARLPELP